MKRLLLATAALLWAGQASAQSSRPSGDAANMAKLLDMHATGTPLAIETVPQDQATIAQLRQNLKSVKLPDGFKIDVYALVPDARHMTVGNNAGVVFVGTRKTRVYAVTDRSKSRTADEVKVFAPSIDFKNPNGMCMSKDGVLYVAEHNKVLAFPAVEFFYESPDVAVQVVADTLIPKSEESFNHGARTCRIGPDNKLYVTLGQPYNVPPHEKAALYAQYGIGGIVRMDRDGSNREVFARGVRNSVGMDFNPKNGELWFTDNQVDGMGDDIPPGELNRSAEGGPAFRLPVLRRRAHPHGGVQGRHAAGRRRVPGESRRWRTPPTSASRSIRERCSRRSIGVPSSARSTARGIARSRWAPA